MAELSAADRAMLQQAQQQARARMSRRTIDETGRDISERQSQPELIQPGWYWTGTHVVWVLGLTARGVYFQAATRPKWKPTRKASSWQRVHEAVTESGQGFGWRPDR